MIPRVLAISPPTVGPWVEELPALAAAGVDGLLLRLVGEEARGPQCAAEVTAEVAWRVPASLRLLVRAQGRGRGGLPGVGLHLPEGEDVRAWRRRQGGLLSASRHDIAGVREALAAGADFVTLAPIFPPGSKPGDDRPPLFPDVFTALAGLPVLALGGIDAPRAAACVAAGACGVAGITCFFREGHVDADSARAIVAAVQEALASSRSAREG